MCLICICKLKSRFEFYIGERAEPKYLMVSDPSAMEKDRLHIYRILAKDLLKTLTPTKRQAKQIALT